MPLQISGRCISHPAELASDLCSTCGDEYCGGCLVSTTSTRRSLCVGCALAAAGVRSTARKTVKSIGGRELKRRRSESERIRNEVRARHQVVDQGDWRIVSPGKPRVATERRSPMPEPVPVAATDIDHDLTAAGFASRAGSVEAGGGYGTWGADGNPSVGGVADGRPAVARPTPDAYRPGQWSPPPMHESTRPMPGRGAMPLRAPRFMERAPRDAGPADEGRHEEAKAWVTYFSDH